jgi:hypothetical protein
MENTKLLFKKYFIPHPGNNHEPHLLRFETTFALLGVVLIVELLFLGQAFVMRNTGWLANILSNVLVDQTNVERQDVGLYGLQVNELLQRAAQLKAEDMAAKGYFAHTTPDGKTPWYWLEQAGYVFAAAGENLAVNFVDSEDVTNAWMESPKHKENILNGGFTEIGIATAKGTYKGKETTFVVQFFGRPMVTPVVAETKPAEESTTPALPEPIADEVPVAEEASGTADGVYIETQSAEDSLLINQAGTTEVIPDKAGFIEQITTQPRAISTLFLITIATIILLALILKVFVAMHIQNSTLIVNGVFVLLVIASALLVNHAVSLYEVAVI